jgi:HlyD family secretion protein
VVTYTVVVVTDNSDGRLLPYLTANLQFQVEHHSNVLKVPNAALRWKPKPDQIAPEARDAAASAPVKQEGKESDDQTAGEAKDTGAKGGEQKGKNPAKPTETKTAHSHHDHGRIWVKEGNYVKPIEVRVVASDGTDTEISGKDVKEDMEVVIGEILAADQGGDTTNPFAPKLFKGRK